MATDKLVTVGTAKLGFKPSYKVSYYFVITFHRAGCVIATTQHIDGEDGAACGTT